MRTFSGARAIGLAIYYASPEKFVCNQCFYIGDSMAVSKKLCCRQNKRKCLSQSAICFLQAQNFPINDQANRGEYTFHKENHEGLFCAVGERT